LTVLPSDGLSYQRPCNGQTLLLTTTQLGAGFSNLARQLRARKAPGRRQEGNCGNDMATMTYDDMHETTFFLEATPLSGIPLESS
jgi:hypothetical protein